MLVSSQPYIKNYLFPFWSLGTLVRVVMLVAAVTLPFFLAYSTPSITIIIRFLSHLEDAST